jgi:CubicO group peptidase (beta-lactamase class C family)
MRTRVFDRAGMTRTYYPLLSDPAEDIAIGYTAGCFGQPPSQCTAQEWRPFEGRPGRGGPAGGAYSTVGDLNRFVEGMRGGTLLSRTTLDLMKAERGRFDQPGGPVDAYGLGFGRLTIHGHPTWGHNGGAPGSQAQVDIFDDLPLTLIVLSNRDGGQRAATAALRDAAA